jgi:hypothetical protein
MVEGTGWDEIVLGVVLLVGGVLYLRFREAALRRSTRTYERWNDAFPDWFMNWYPVRVGGREPFLRWVTTLAGVFLVVVGIAFIVWGIVWGWK